MIRRLSFVLTICVLATPGSAWAQDSTAMRAGNAGIDTVIAGAGRQNLDANVVGWAAPHTSWAYDRGPQCVPFARALSSISLFGDAWHWWSAAAGRYDRGFKPQAGSVLSFRPDARMPLGHLAVVTRVISAREIEVDHANWALPGAITRKAQVLDVSTDNDWTAVRVGLRERDHFGAVYTTNGFIYGRPIELGPQIVDVAEVLRNRRERQAVSNSPENSGLPIVVEGGRIRSAQPAVFSQSDPGWPIVMRLGRS